MRAGNILKLAGPNYVERTPEHLRDAMIETLNKVHAAADTFNRGVAANGANGNLSEKGRAEGRKAVAVSALAALSAVEANTVKPLADRAAAIEKSMLGKATYTPPKDPAERISHELHLQEIRSQLRELPASERLVVYQTTTDPMVLAAIESAPMTLSAPREDGSRRVEPFIDPEQRTAAVIARAERADPATMNTLREVQALRDVYTMAVNSVRREILDEVPGAQEPAITVR